jgi:hypothetical protein
MSSQPAVRLRSVDLDGPDPRRSSVLPPHGAISDLTGRCQGGPHIPDRRPTAGQATTDPRSAASAGPYPIRAQVRPPHGVLPVQGVVALFPDEHRIHCSLAAWDNASYGWVRQRQNWLFCPNQAQPTCHCEAAPSRRPDQGTVRPGLHPGRRAAGPGLGRHLVAERALTAWLHTSGSASATGKTADPDGPARPWAGRRRRCGGAVAGHAGRRAARRRVP